MHKGKPQTRINTGFVVCLFDFGKRLSVKNLCDTIIKNLLIIQEILLVMGSSAIILAPGFSKFLEFYKSNLFIRTLRYQRYYERVHAYRI